MMGSSPAVPNTTTASGLVGCSHDSHEQLRYSYHTGNQGDCHSQKIHLWMCPHADVPNRVVLSTRFRADGMSVQVCSAEKRWHGSGNK